MKKALFLLFAASLMTALLPSCRKKEAPNQSIVGAWKMMSFSGSKSSFNSSYSGRNDYLYINSLATLSATSRNTTDTTLYKINSEVWTFKDDGSVSINESYTDKTGTKNLQLTGHWQYNPLPKSAGFKIDDNVNFLIDSLMGTKTFAFFTSEQNNTLTISYNSEASIDSVTATYSGIAEFTRQ